MHFILDMFLLGLVNLFVKKPSRDTSMEYLIMDELDDKKKKDEYSSTNFEYQEHPESVIDRDGESEW